MGIVLTAEERFRAAQREANNLRTENLNLMEMIAEQEFYICLLELGVSYDDL
jgi:hypothetical protein